MATTIRTELSEKNPWWIPRQRYYELKHFCLQYPDWKIQLKVIDGYQHQAEFTDMPKDVSNDIFDPVARTAEARDKLEKKISMVELAAREAEADLSDYILKGITEGIPYSILQFKIGIPCCKDVYYDRYRKFFWILDKLRD